MSNEIMGNVNEKKPSFEKQPPGMFFKKICPKHFCKIHRKGPVSESIFNKVAGLSQGALAQMLSC